MRTMEHAIRFASSITLLLCVSFNFGLRVSAQQASSAGIVGRWRSLETSKGGIGAMYEFRSDGTVDFSPGAIVEMPWRIENDQLILPPGTNDGAEQKQTLKWLGDNKLGLATESGVTELARVGDHVEAGNPIIGEWIEMREMAGSKLEAHWLFYPGGKLLLLVPFVTQHGSYTISGSTLHFKVRGLEPEFRFELKNNLLTLSELEGREAHRYARY